MGEVCLKVFCQKLLLNKVYPNPSRDIFNVSFVSEEVQDLEIRIVNLLGEVIFIEE